MTSRKSPAGPRRRSWTRRPASRSPSPSTSSPTARRSTWGPRGSRRASSCSTRRSSRRTSAPSLASPPPPRSPRSTRASSNASESATRTSARTSTATSLSPGATRSSPCSRRGSRRSSSRPSAWSRSRSSCPWLPPSANSAYGSGAPSLHPLAPSSRCGSPRSSTARRVPRWCTRSAPSRRLAVGGCLLESCTVADVLLAGTWLRTVAARRRFKDPAHCPMLPCAAGVGVLWRQPHVRCVCCSSFVGT
mmetsp:Transcript_54/g.165  ORF Transcript_54/g.165 Transcript_54/m.165 type:complete len:248 (-) Transcript_54:33-776(-)